MKTILVALILLAVAPAFAGDLYSFVCKTTQVMDAGSRTTIKFNMKLSPQGKWQYIDTSEEETFKVTPKKSQMFELNENGAIYNEKNTVTFFGDGDGIVLVYLTLYKNTHYRSGYARIKDRSGANENFYSPVECKIQNY